MNTDMAAEVEEIVSFFSACEMKIFLGPRPGKKSLNTLRDLSLTHCCTLLSEREDVQPISKICRNLGCEWVWLPIEGGRLEILDQTDVVGHLRTLHESIASEPLPRVYFHCSAGIHRTGFFVYLLLRFRGLNGDQAFDGLKDLRPVTAEQVGEERLELADNLIAKHFSG